MTEPFAPFYVKELEAKIKALEDKNKALEEAIKELQAWMLHMKKRY